jgi:hypothetical protein
MRRGTFAQAERKRQLHKTGGVARRLGGAFVPSLCRSGTLESDRN